MQRPLRVRRLRRIAPTLWSAVLVAWPALAVAQIEAPEVPPETQEDIAPSSPTPASEPAAAVSDAPAGSISAPPVELSTPPAPLELIAATPSLRSAGGALELVPIAEVELDSSYARAGDSATNGGVRMRRAQAGLGAHIGGRLRVVVAGEYAVVPGAGDGGVASRIAPADVFAVIAPWGGDRFTLQVGQFDAPFTLENRTRDGALDFRERSLAVRALGNPDHRDVGAMLSGHAGERLLYSVGIFNGDGPRFVNADDQYDLIGRVFVAPFSIAGYGPLRGVTIGGSGRIGDRANTVALPAQATPGGLAFLDFAPYLAAPGGSGRARSVQLRQVGLMRALAGELNAPFGHRLGVRGEMVWRKSPLSEEDLSGAQRPVILGGANLIGWAAYGEFWAWILGDDRIIGDRYGIEPSQPASAPGSAQHGLVVAVRGERLDETVSLEWDATNLNLHDPAVGRTRVSAGEVAFSYWHTRRLRATVDYVFSRIDGTTSQIRALPSPNVHEVGVRLALAL